jgi:hypothetical protein
VIHRCPKCQAYIKPALPDDAQCPQCGIWFHKWNAPLPAGPVAAIDLDDDEGGIPIEPYDPAIFYGRVVLLALVAAWGVVLAATNYRNDDMTRSFMHLILLPIHEAGHVLFMPFGAFMTTAGGSLFQVALPLGIAIAFYLKERQPFGSAICVWWTGASLVDLSVYVWDALHPQLILTSGTTGEDGGHDWVAILGDIGQLKHAHGWGTTINWLGVLVMAGGLAWAAWYCWMTWRERSVSSD